MTMAARERKKRKNDLEYVSFLPSSVIFCGDSAWVAGKACDVPY